MENKSDLLTACQILHIIWLRPIKRLPLLTLSLRGSINKLKPREGRVFVEPREGRVCVLRWFRQCNERAAAVYHQSYLGRVTCPFWAHAAYAQFNSANCLAEALAVRHSDKATHEYSYAMAWYACDFA